jgi:hypothetical protein
MLIQRPGESPARSSFHFNDSTFRRQLDAHSIQDWSSLRRNGLRTRGLRDRRARSPHRRILAGRDAHRTDQPGGSDLVAAMLIRNFKGEEKAQNVPGIQK